MKVTGAKQQKNKFSISIFADIFYYYVFKINRNIIYIYMHMCMYMYVCLPKCIASTIHNSMLS